MIIEDELNWWDLIAGRIPNRKPEEIERFWIMGHDAVFAGKRNEHRRLQIP